MDLVQKPNQLCFSLDQKTKRMVVSALFRSIPLCGFITHFRMWPGKWKSVNCVNFDGNVVAVEGEDDDICDVDAFAGLFFALDLVIVCFASVKLFDSRFQKTENTELPWSRGFQSLTLWGPLRQNRDNRCLFSVPEISQQCQWDILSLSNITKILTVQKSSY